MSTRSLYELLGSRPEATSSELRFDYERALATAHRNGATKHAHELVQAYELLSDPARRHTYDTTGISIPRERVPNTFGQAVPFRSVLPGLGQSAPVPQGRSASTVNSGAIRATRKAARAQALQMSGDQAGAQRAAMAADKLQKGVEGEALIAQILDGLVVHGWHVLHDRRKSPASPSNLDHVVIGPPGVLVIDSKNWSGGRLRLDDRGMALGRFRKDDELQSAKIDADIVRDLVRQIPPGAPVCGVLAFVQDLGIEAPERHRDVFVLQRDQLWNWLWTLPPVLSAEQVGTLGASLNSALPPRAQAPSSRPRATMQSTARRAPTSARRRSKSEPSLAGLMASLGVLGAIVLAAPHSGPLIDWVSKQLTPVVTPHVAKPSPTPAPHKAVTRSVKH